ncbi:P-II family nitrogen regulator (plasmid) [Cupriavidus basilensis]|uniref:P-II family nitrogen regulator n=1 Tax=unclassified Cupriavidus TaxID=2640874 RepID=UPI0010F61CF7|nr:MULTISPECIES: P-II family nitrogen regulator [unclassified Cupriavidus]MWL92195.1 P-II family nitrogen regulator [Cupriavidus sp. SW-Y-13]
MSTKCVVAIVPSDLLEKLEQQFATVHVPGLTATRVKGYGEYKNFFSSDLTSVHTKIEIFVEEESVQAIADAIFQVARSSVPGAGIVAVMPVDQLLHLHAPATELNP